MLADTCWVPWAACCTLRETSLVAAPCSSTAAAMVDAISESRSMVPLISLIAPTESWVAAWMPVTSCPISPVALAADLVDGGRQFFRCGGHRLHVGGGLFGSRSNRGRHFLRPIRGSRQRAGRGFELGRRRGHGLDDLADHRFKIARDGIDPAPAF